MILVGDAACALISAGASGTRERERGGGGGWERRNISGNC